MRLKKIQLNNYLSHSETILEIEDDQKFLLDGKSGAGKSSIIDSLIWALYGRGRSDNRSLIKKGKKYAKVVVTMEDNSGTKYSIARAITSTGKHDLSVTRKTVTDKKFSLVEASGIKNIQDYIEKQILHSSYLLFLNSIVYPQDNIDSFVKQTAARRKEIILEIVNASDYDEYYKKAKEKVKELEIAVGSTEVAITEIENKLKKDKENLPSLTELTTKLENIETDMKEGKERLETALTKKFEIESILSDKSDKDKEFIYANYKIQELIVEIKDLNEKKNSLSVTSVDELKNDVKKKMNRLTELRTFADEINTWNEKMMELITLAPVNKDYEETGKRLNSQIIDLMKKDIEICPEIGKACPIIVKELDSRIAGLSGELDMITKEEKEYIKKKTDYDRMINSMGEKPMMSTIESSDLGAYENYINKSEKRIKEIEQGTLSVTIDISVKEKELDNLETKKKELKDESETLGLKLDELKIEYPEEKTRKLEKEFESQFLGRQKISQEIAITENNRTRIKNEEKELKRMKDNIKDDQDSLKSMKLLKEAFGNNGIKAIVIDHVIPRLEDKINDILSKLSDFRVCLDTQRKGVNEDKNKEGLFIDIINENGEILDFESYSGGEKMKINMAIFEALASLSNIDFRIFDETFLAIDQESSENFLEVIKEIRKNVRQFVCVSHMQNIKDFFQDKINIIKINGDSSIS